MVFGGGGQVGCHLIEMASATGHDLVGLTHEEVDICDAGAVGDAIAGHSPTCIVNAAAYTAVDKAESDAMRSIAVNRDGASVAEAAAKVKIPLIHRTIEQRQGWMIACIEEITYRSGFIDAEQLLRIAASLKNTYYGRYLEAVAQEARHQY